MTIEALRASSLLIVLDDSPLSSLAPLVVKNCSTLRFQGQVLALSLASSQELVGVDVYGHLDAMPEMPPLAVILAEAESTVSIATELVGRGVKVLCVVGGGYPSSKSTQAQLGSELRALAVQHGCLVIGPSGGGYIDTVSGIAPFAGNALQMVKRGRIGLAAQGGGVVEAFSTSDRVPLSTAISCGRGAVLEMADFLHYFSADPHTDAVLAFVEGVQNGNEFLDAAYALAEVGKPLAVCKVGRSPLGKVGVASHSGRLAGDDRVFRAALKSVGAVSCADLDELFAVGELLTAPVRPLSTTLHLLAYSGAEANLLTDLADSLGLKLPSISVEGQRALCDVWPQLEVSNPLDPWDIADYRQVYGRALATFASEPGALLGLAIDQNPRPEDPLQSVTRNLVGMLAHEAARTGKTPVVLSPVSQPPSQDVLSLCRSLRVPVLQGARTGLSALAKVAAMSSDARPSSPSVGKGGSRFAGEPETLDEDRSLRILSGLGLQVAARRRVGDPDSAVAAAGEIGYPVVVKALSSSIPHKMVRGLVRLDLRNEEEVWMASADVLAACAADECAEILVAEYVTGQLEVYVGMKRDECFGPAMLLGLGGTWAETFDRVQIRLAPVSDRDVMDMIGASDVARFSSGVGQLSTVAIADVLHKVSRLSIEDVRILAVDVNPLVVTAERAVAVDAMVVVATNLSNGGGDDEKLVKGS